MPLGTGTSLLYNAWSSWGLSWQVHESLVWKREGDKREVMSRSVSSYYWANYPAIWSECPGGLAQW